MAELFHTIKYKKFNNLSERDITVLAIFSVWLEMNGYLHEVGSDDEDSQKYTEEFIADFVLNKNSVDMINNSPRYMKSALDNIADLIREGRD